MDVLTKEQRRKNMQAIKGKDSDIEILLRKALWERGYRYRKNYKKLKGSPDIVLTKHKIAIFCDSEFWHGYNWDVQKQRVKTNSEFWDKKILNNIKRDKEVNEYLTSQGWTVIRFWDRDIKKNIDECVKKIKQAIQ